MYSNQNNSATVSKLTFQVASTGWAGAAAEWPVIVSDLSPKTSDNYALLY